MVIKEKLVRRKTIKSLEAARKFFKNQEDKITEAVWKDHTLEILFDGGSFKVDKITPEEAALLLNYFFLAPGSLYFSAIGQMTVQNDVHFNRII